jgi:hypothetical protein
MLNHTAGSAIGFLILSFLTWSITFAILVFGVMLRRKILLWDDQWKESTEEGGVSIRDYAEGLERTFEKMRSTFRLLGFFVVVLVGLMVWVGYLNLGTDRPLLGMPQVMSSLWLLTLVMLSVVLPAFINFGIGTYVAETMLLKANAFVHKDVKEEMREKRAKIRMMEKAKELKAQREAMRNAKAAPETAAAETPAKAPAGK